jgi:microcompartment protein CcmL/EutN
MKALGLIENRSYLASVVAADIALKTADVRLVDMEIVKGGYVTVQLVGDVAAVRAAVDAGSNAAETFGRLISSHVIARMHEETEQLIKTEEDESVPEEEPEVSSEEPEQLEEPEEEIEAVIEEKEEIQPTLEQVDEAFTRDGLSKMTVSELRKLVRQRNVMADEIKEIKYARKADLIDRLLDMENIDISN